MSWETIADELERLRAENSELRADKAALLRDRDDLRKAVANLMGVVSETRRVLRSASDVERRAVEGDNGPA